MEISVNIKLTQKDRELFMAIAKTKLLTISQAYRLFYNSKNTAYKRMKNLEKAGYLTSRPHVEQRTGRKMGTCYYLTQQGYEVIGINHYNPSKLIEPWKHDYRVAVSELYTQLTLCGFEFKASREIKYKYNLNRNTKVACSLIRPNSYTSSGEDEILIYILGNSPAEDTIEKVQAEIARSGGNFDAVIVLHFGSKQNISYRTRGENNIVKYITWNEPLGIKNLHTLKYKRGIELLKLMYEPDYIIKSPFSDSFHEQGVEYLEREHSDFSEHIVNYKGRTCYLVELVSNNLSVIKNLREYSKEDALIKKRYVLCLVPAGEEIYWREYFNKKYYPHMKFLPVNINEAEKLKINSLTG